MCWGVVMKKSNVGNPRLLCIPFLMFHNIHQHVICVYISGDISAFWNINLTVPIRNCVILLCTSTLESFCYTCNRSFCFLQSPISCYQLFSQVLTKLITFFFFKSIFSRGQLFQEIQIQKAVRNLLSYSFSYILFRQFF